MSKLRYTLRLTTNGAEVWKRYTGDRDEMRRLAVAALSQMDLHFDDEIAERGATMFLLPLQDTEPVEPAEDVVSWGSEIHSQDFIHQLTLEVHRKG